MLSMKFLFSRCFTHAIISSSARLVKVVAIHSVPMAPSTPEVIVDWVFQLAYSISFPIFRLSKHSRTCWLFCSQQFVNVVKCV